MPSSKYSTVIVTLGNFHQFLINGYDKTILALQKLV